jgi:DNA-binding transcriptional LysR family regulator
MRKPLYLAVPSIHPLADRKSVTFDDFAREPAVMLDKPNNLRILMDQIYSRRGVIPNVVFEVRECNAALQYVALRFGVSVVPEVPALKNDQISVIPIEDPDQEFVRTVYLCWNKNRPLSPASARFRDYIQDHCSET